MHTHKQLKELELSLRLIEQEGTNTEDDADGADAAVYSLLSRAFIPNQFSSVNRDLD